MKTSPFKALSHPPFRNIWFAMFMSRIGTEMQNVGINWHVYMLTKSPLALGLIGLFRIAPIIFFSLIGGVVADHVNRKKLLLITQCLSIFFAGILTIITFKKIDNLTLL
ncbi:MFS transporter, partial [Candidatus Roizmanbacteria bacterium CG_4_10_14_0_8_um_filter_33_9]